MTRCASCHHPYDAHYVVYKHDVEWPCAIAGCACTEFTLRAPEPIVETPE